MLCMPFLFGAFEEVADLRADVPRTYRLSPMAWFSRVPRFRKSFIQRSKSGSPSFKKFAGSPYCNDGPRKPDRSPRSMSGQRNACCACGTQYGGDETADVCLDCAFESPWGCQHCEMSGRAKCSACMEEDCVAGRGAFPRWSTRFPWLVHENKRHLLGFSTRKRRLDITAL